MPEKLNTCKEGQADNKKIAAACLCFLNYLAFFQPADREVSEVSEL
jgi:hypothetical protein